TPPDTGPPAGTRPDATPHDTGPPAATRPDTTPPDTTPHDTGPPVATRPDAGADGDRTQPRSPPASPTVAPTPPPATDPQARAAAPAEGTERERRIRIARQRRRRRPTGAAPPLPRHLGRAARTWLALLGLLVLWLAILLASPTARHATSVADTAVLRVLASARTDWLTDLARFVDRLITGWTRTVVALAVLVALMVFKRWRHLFTYLGSIVVVELVAMGLFQALARPRPYDVTIVGRWAGYSAPSAPVLVLAAVLVAIIHGLVPAGRARGRAQAVAAAVLAVAALARLYLGIDHPFDVLLGVALGIAPPYAAFRWFTPDDAVPVAYRGGKTAHLDVTGARGEAIRRAIADQLGVTVVEAKPVGLEGSAGSTPLRLRVLDPVTGEEAEQPLFAKLFAMNHVRADRFYKLGRRVLYGKLEDEVRFESIRRLVEYEDYTLRLMRDAGIPTSAPYGIVEITPDREYMLITSFIEGAVEIGDAEVDDDIIDQGLRLVRVLWDAGLAHRDIKPANLMVRDGELFMIDPAFAQVRPSPWRQAVDLGNMMLVLAVRCDAERVYRRALLQFSEDELGEAFAAARGVASPTQLRSVLKQDGRDILGQFRRLAPARPPVSLQRWSLGRIALAAGLAVVLVLAAVSAFNLFTPTHDLAVEGSPRCDTGNLTILMAQSVPSATLVPCLGAVPVGWSAGNADVERDRGRFWLVDDADPGDRVVEVTLRPAGECDVSGATPVASDEVGTDRYEQPREVDPGLRGTRYYLFEGGCVTYDFEFGSSADPGLVFGAESAIGFIERAKLADRIHADTGLALCGAGETCTGG
ncbi:MAG TPA: phosphatase PAP2 family protein, partial [Acidimicrobiales bacterium]|nr:phosphatase PAP2 family protein [Acidimicrobiales bacterium]